jgi:hypothetical protein
VLEVSEKNKLILQANKEVRQQIVTEACEVMEKVSAPKKKRGRKPLHRGKMLIDRKNILE